MFPTVSAVNARCIHRAQHRASNGARWHAQAEASGESKKDSQGSLAPVPSADSVKVQHKGRFEVYDSDASASSEARTPRGRCVGGAQSHLLKGTGHKSAQGAFHGRRVIRRRFGARTLYRLRSLLGPKQRPDALAGCCASRGKAR